MRGSRSTFVGHLRPTALLIVGLPSSTPTQITAECGLPFSSSVVMTAWFLPSISLAAWPWMFLVAMALRLPVHRQAQSPPERPVVDPLDAQPLVAALVASRDGDGPLRDLERVGHERRKRL